MPRDKNLFPFHSRLAKNLLADLLAPRRSRRRHAASTSRALVRALGPLHAPSTDPTRPEMTVGNLLVRNHNVLAKACLGGGFAFGFAYTNNTGTSPIRDVASAAGTCRSWCRSRRCFPRIECRRVSSGRSRVSRRASSLERSARARLRRTACRKNRARGRNNERQTRASDLWYRTRFTRSSPHRPAGLENEKQQTTFTIRTSRSNAT